MGSHSRTSAQQNRRRLFVSPGRRGSAGLAKAVAGICHSSSSSIRTPITATNTVKVEDFESYAKADAAENKSAPVGPKWPELHSAALMGLPGDVVRAVSPHSEADSAAILFQFLVAAGNALGRDAFYLVEGDRHGTNLFAVMVGDSAKGRKGTSWGRVRAIMEIAEPCGRPTASSAACRAVKA